MENQKLADDLKSFLNNCELFQVLDVDIPERGDAPAEIYLYPITLPDSPVGETTEFTHRLMDGLSIVLARQIELHVLSTKEVVRYPREG